VLSTCADQSGLPSIVSRGDNQTVYIVVDDFGRSGRPYRETEVEDADLETTITNLTQGEYSNPVRIVSFNTAEKWSEDPSADSAYDIRRRCDLQAADVLSTIQGFVERHDCHSRQLTLRLI
jgi:hypothetical protein